MCSYRYQATLSHTHAHYSTQKLRKFQHIFMISIVSYYYTEIIWKHILVLHNSIMKYACISILYILASLLYIYIYVNHELFTQNRKTYKYSQCNNRYITIAYTLFIEMYLFYLFMKQKLQVQRTFTVLTNSNRILISYLNLYEGKIVRKYPH